MNINKMRLLPHGKIKVNQMIRLFVVAVGCFGAWGLLGHFFPTLHHHIAFTAFNQTVTWLTIGVVVFGVVAWRASK